MSTESQDPRFWGLSGQLPKLLLWPHEAPEGQGLAQQVGQPRGPPVPYTWAVGRGAHR